MMFYVVYKYVTHLLFHNMFVLCWL